MLSTENEAFTNLCPSMFGSHFSTCILVNLTPIYKLAVLVHLRKKSILSNLTKTDMFTRGTVGFRNNGDMINIVKIAIYRTANR